MKEKDRVEEARGENKRKDERKNRGIRGERESFRGSVSVIGEFSGFGR